MKEVLQEKVYVTDSSLIEYLTYDFEREILGVKYKEGKHKQEYREYSHISKETYAKILKSDSKGKALLRAISKAKNEMSFGEKLSDWVKDIVG